MLTNSESLYAQGIGKIETTTALFVLNMLTIHGAFGK